jgi:hypothetical protein
MTTEQDIHKQVEREYDKFRDALYDGPPLPADIIHKFRQGLMVVPWGTHKYNLFKVQELISKQPDELTWLEAGMVINFVTEVPYERLFDTLEDALAYQTALSGIIAQYNIVTSKKSKELESYRNRLLSTSGIIRTKLITPKN